MLSLFSPFSSPAPSETPRIIAEMFSPHRKGISRGFFLSNQMGIRIALEDAFSPFFAEGN